MKNYTSTVEASRSIEQIEQLLVRAKAMNISKSFDAEGRVQSLLFTLRVSESPLPMAIQLPAKADAVFEVLRKACKSHPTAAKIKSLKKQAERTAWRLMFDWLGVQLSLIELRQVEAAQVFMPFAWNGRQTYFETIKAAGFVPLLGPPPPDNSERDNA